LLGARSRFGCGRPLRPGGMTTPGAGKKAARHGEGDGRVGPGAVNVQALTLRTLRNEDEPAFLAAVQAFKRTRPEWQFAFSFDDAGDFPRYVRLLERRARGVDLPEGFVASTYLVAFIEKAIVGRVSIRHELNDWLLRVGGHIGYGVVPSCRRRGYATEMLRQALGFAAGLGIRHALVTCDVDNVASRRVIEKNGGVFEGLTDEPTLDVQKRRYWIDTAKSHPPPMPRLPR
jgi:predicted acetyltransferase